MELARESGRGMSTPETAAWNRLLFVVVVVGMLGDVVILEWVELDGPVRDQVADHDDVRPSQSREAE